MYHINQPFPYDGTGWDRMFHLDFAAGSLKYATIEAKTLGRSYRLSSWHSALGHSYATGLPLLDESEGYNERSDGRKSME